MKSKRKISKWSLALIGLSSLLVLRSIALPDDEAPQDPSADKSPCPALCGGLSLENPTCFFGVCMTKQPTVADPGTVTDSGDTTVQDGSTDSVSSD